MMTRTPSLFTLRYFTSALMICALALVAGCDKQSADSPILIKFPHVTAPATPKGRAADRFAELVEERLAGRVTVEVYPSGQLMSDDDSMDALAFGEVQMIAFPVSKLDRLTQRFQVFDLPFLFPDLQAIEAFQASEHGQELLTSLVDRNILGLSFWHNGMKQFGGPVPMRTPDAANGLKFRIMESDVLQAQILQIGGNPQKMAFGEVYQALQTGAVDAQENTWSNIYSSKFYEVQAHVTESNHGYVGYMLTVNPEFWGSLPGDIRTELEAIAKEVGAWVNEESVSINLAGKEKIVASGRTEVTELSDAERAVWQQTMRPVWEAFSDSIGADVIAAAEAYGQ